MANVNKVVRRRQVALLIALVLGIGAGGAGTRDEPEESAARKSAKRRTRAGYDRCGQSVI